MNFRRLVPKSEFGRSIVALLSGTVLAQAIPVALSPLLTRLFLPAEMGVLAQYLSCVAICAVVATGRYELAIVLPKDDDEAFDIFAFASQLAVMVSLAAIPLLYFGASLSDVFRRVAGERGWLILLPAGIALAGIAQALTYWVSRRREFARVSFARLVQAGVMGTVQLFAGITGVGGALGLVVASVLGQVAMVGALLAWVWRQDRARLLGVGWSRPWAAARKHAGFPKFMVAGQLANVASSQTPVLLLGVLYGPQLSGFYMLAERVMVLPASVVGTSIGDVFRQYAAKQHLEQGHCYDLYLRTAKQLALVAIIPAVVVVAFGPVLFSAVFGASWRPAGEIAVALAAMVFFQSIASPLSQTVLLTGMFRADMIWQFARLALAIGSIYGGYLLAKNPMVSIVCYAAILSIMYCIHMLMQIKAAKGGPGRALNPAMSAA